MRQVKDVEPDLVDAVLKLLEVLGSPHSWVVKYMVRRSKLAHLKGDQIAALF